MSVDNVIAFQGELGAYSHLACQEVYPDMTPLPSLSFEDAFAAVSANQAALAMIPIENSLGGRVADIHHLLPESSLHIIGEHYQSVNHCLLAPEGASLETLESVRSHPQALAQCRKFIRALGIHPIAGTDTAGAARQVAERGDITLAALASSLAGEIHGLVALRTNVADRESNTTRFVMMSKDPIRPNAEDESCMTSLIFEVRSTPAVLYKALGGFATNNVNITKLESYIGAADFRIAQFYLEIEGHPTQPNVVNALDELQYFSKFSTLRILGVYPAHPRRMDQA